MRQLQSKFITCLLIRHAVLADKSCHFNASASHCLAWWVNGT